MKKRNLTFYSIALLLSILVMPKAIEYAYKQRGYKAYGGEMLLPILFIALAFISDELWIFIKTSQKEKR